MSIKEKIRSLFKKKIIEVNQTPSLSGLYVAKSSDVKKIADQVNHIQDTLDNLNIPTIPDHSNFALKNADNEFVNQSIKGNTSFISFKDSAGNRKGYVGKSSSSNNHIELNAENGDLNLKASGLITINKQPTSNSGIVNKGYVDNQITTINNNITTATNATLAESKQYTNEEIAKIPQPDLSNYAKKNEPNTFSGLQSFNNISATGIDVDNIMCRHNLQYTGQITLGNNVVTKEYVDNLSSNIPPACYEYTGVVRTLYTKRDINSNLWYYIVGETTIKLNGVPNNFRGKSVFAIIELHDINVPNQGWKVTQQFCGVIKFTVPASGNINVTTQQVDFVYHWDLKPGSGGDTVLDTQFHVALFRLN